MREFDEKLELRIPHNAWQKELDWASYNLHELGLSSTQPHPMHRSSKTVGIGNTGNWSAKEYIPMGYLENQETEVLCSGRLSIMAPGIGKSVTRTGTCI